MADMQAIGWPWWTAPARLIGRVRPGLIAAAEADATVLMGLPRAVRTVLIPLTVLAIAAAFAALHAFSPGFSTGSEPAFPLNWLRLHFDYVYTELPLFIIAAAVIGALSPAAAVLFVLSFGAFDFVAAAMHPEELRMSAARPFAVVGRLVAYWLLWLLAVEIPIFGRALAVSIRRLAGNRLAVAAVCGVATGALTFFWAEAAAVLLRPLYLWSDIGGPYAQGFVPLQQGGRVIGLVAGAAAAAVALVRGPRHLLHRVTRQPEGAAAEPGPLALAKAVVWRVVVAALLTIGLGGLITKPIDAVVIFIAIAGALPLARLIGERIPIGEVMGRLPPIVRLAAAVALILPISYLLVYDTALRSVSEFFSVIVVFALGLFVIGLLASGGSARRRLRPSTSRTVGAGTTLVLVLLSIGLIAPVPVYADNGLSLIDIWNVVSAAALGAIAIPILTAVAVSEWLWGRYMKFGDDLLGPRQPPPPPPPPPYLPKPPPTTEERERRQKYHDSDEYKEEVG